ncbi:22673_t:CDS:2 [Rhizophagus irregularis]|nr:22673_t:CDS:2 [Rhizophagus irregularis]
MESRAHHLETDTKENNLSSKESEPQENFESMRKIDFNAIKICLCNPNEPSDKTNKSTSKLSPIKSKVKQTKETEISRNTGRRVSQKFLIFVSADFPGQLCSLVVIVLTSKLPFKFIIEIASQLELHHLSFGSNTEFQL